MDNVIFAENVGNWYQLDPDNYKVKISEVYDDYEHRHWWEKGVYFDYDFMVYYNPKTNKEAVVVSYWDIRGKVLGCGDCAMTKLWYVRERADDQEEADLIREVLKEIEPAIPHKVHVKFLKEIDTILGIKVYTEEEVIKL